MDNLVTRAIKMLREDEDYLQDARDGTNVNNTVIGSILAITTGSPRWATEAAVQAALQVIDGE